MSNSSPLALFLTWTVYGTFLPGDRRGWRHRQDGIKPAQPLLEQWHRDGLNYDVVLLNAAMQAIAETAITEICTFRTWRLWAVSVRSNHAHVLLTAPNYRPIFVRDQLKAKATTHCELHLKYGRIAPFGRPTEISNFLTTTRILSRARFTYPKPKIGSVVITGTATREP